MNMIHNYITIKYKKYYFFFLKWNKKNHPHDQVEKIYLRDGHKDGLNILQKT